MWVDLRLSPTLDRQNYFPTGKGKKQLLKKKYYFTIRSEKLDIQFLIDLFVKNIISSYNDQKL